MKRLLKAGMAIGLLAVTGIAVDGSSHREAPGITKTPKVDGTDFYMFKSDEAGRAGYVTLLANYVPLQDVYGGPNFFTLDPDAVYEIHVDNTGDGREDLTFQFQSRTRSRDLAVPVGDRMVAIPLVNIGGIGPAASDNENLNVLETYSVTMIRGDRRFGRRDAIRNAADGRITFRKPVDRIGDKSLRDNDPSAYAAYADNHIYGIKIPGCGDGKVFVGQRREGLCREPGRSLRPDQHEPARSGRRRGERARRQEHHDPGARSARRVPGVEPRSRDRRLDNLEH